MALPSVRLRPFIRSLWQLDVGPHDDAMPGWIAPDGQVEIVFHTGAPALTRHFGSDHWQRQPQAFVLPMRRGSLQLASTGADCIVALRVDPVVASALLRRPMGELWDAMTPLRELIGSQADQLVEAIARAAPVRRFQIIEHWIETRLGGWTGSSDELRAIHERLFWRGDGTPLDKVAREIGVSMRSLRRRTSETTGLSPKELELTGRILRACTLLRDQAQAPIASVALDVGFYDQAAFSHAFAQQVGMPPSTFRSLPVVYCETQ